MLAVVLGWSRRCEVNLRRLSSASRASLKMYVSMKYCFMASDGVPLEEKWLMKFVKLPLCIEGFSSSNPHVDVTRGGAVKGEDVTLKLKQSHK